MQKTVVCCLFELHLIRNINWLNVTRWGCNCNSTEISSQSITKWQIWHACVCVCDCVCLLWLWLRQADAMCIIWTVRQCIHLLSSIRLSVRMSICPSGSWSSRNQWQSWFTCGWQLCSSELKRWALWGAWHTVHIEMICWPNRQMQLNELCLMAFQVEMRLKCNLKCKTFCQPPHAARGEWDSYKERDRVNEKGRWQQGMLPKNGATLKMPILLVSAQLADCQNVGQNTKKSSL